jgi:16S rRNA (adenine1518-N6/adenine1519-N6)-dimethyltransferase
MKLSEMRQVLATENLTLTKSLGQNFLHDGNQLARIVSAAALAGADSVVEIGPGLGPLTERLVAEAGHVLAIEKDRRLFVWLERHFRPCRNLELVHADALDLIQQTRPDWQDRKLVANLPYAVASAIVVELAQSRVGPGRLVITVQREVAQRIVAGPGSAEYGLLSLLVQLAYEPHGSFRIPATCFFPTPDVDSACLTLVRRPRPLLELAQTVTFRRVIKRAFSQRRKMMAKLLRSDWPATALAAAYAQAQLAESVRAEQVSLAQFIELTRGLHFNKPAPA